MHTIFYLIVLLPDKGEDYKLLLYTNIYKIIYARHAACIYYFILVYALIICGA